MFKPTEHQAKIWFHKLNKSIFDGKITPMPKIEIRRRHKIWGEASWNNEDVSISTLISLTTRFRSKQHFLSILAHEMVHIYQAMVGDTGNHNALFYSFRKKFEEQGLLLKRVY